MQGTNTFGKTCRRSVEVFWSTCLDVSRHRQVESWCPHGRLGLVRSAPGF